MILVSFADFFFTSGRWMMLVMMLLLVFVLLSAWKHPAWTIPLGKIALVVVVLEVICKLIDLGSVIQETGSWIHPGILGGGIKLLSGHLLCARCVYLFALIADMIRNKRK